MKKSDWLKISTYYRLSSFCLLLLYRRFTSLFSARDGLRVKPVSRRKSGDATYMVVFALTLLGELLVGMVFAFLIVVLLLALLVLSQDLVILGLDVAGGHK